MHGKFIPEPNQLIFTNSGYCDEMSNFSSNVIGLEISLRMSIALDMNTQNPEFKWQLY